MSDGERKKRVSEAMRVFMGVGRSHRTAIDKFTAALDIHRSQNMLLMYLNMTENQPSQKELCDHFGVSAATVAVTLKKLEKNGYVERSRFGRDNRINRIRVTEKGKRILARTKLIFDKCDEIVFDGFSDSEMELLVSMMSRMKANIENPALYGDIVKETEDIANEKMA